MKERFGSVKTKRILWCHGKMDLIVSLQKDSLIVKQHCREWPWDMLTIFSYSIPNNTIGVDKVRFINIMLLLAVLFNMRTANKELITANCYEILFYI